VAIRRTSLKKQIRTIRRSTRLIARALNALETKVRAVERNTMKKAGPQKRKIRITPKRRALLKLQGSYMGFMRQLKPAQKARIKALKEKKGFEAAIKAARMLAGQRAQRSSRAA
jgi:hypothetical protein